MSQKVHREKHRMEAFIRFQKSSRGLYFALIHPDFNVLPLIIRHFKNRYADQPWVIYDEKRKYGVHYDGNTVQEVTLELHAESQAPVISADLLLDEEEALYALLWKDYFRSTNIPARKNMKLHLQHVPKRYWRYLTEKQ
jgi:probable DNA metabolism protein